MYNTFLIGRISTAREDKLTLTIFCELENLILMFCFKTDIQRSHSKKKKLTKSRNSFGSQYGIFPLQSTFNYLSKILLNTQNTGSLECSVERLLKIILELLVKTN